MMLTVGDFVTVIIPLILNFIMSHYGSDKAITTLCQKPCVQKAVSICIAFASVVTVLQVQICIV